MSSFDVIVLGAGPAGEVCAGQLAMADLRVAIVEPHLVGGECSFYACMPSKALLHPGQVLDEAHRTPGVTGGAIDATAALARRDEVIHDLDDSGQLPWLEDQGITLIRERGVLEGERRVRAGDQILTAERAVVLATGSTARIPDSIEGLAEAQPWTNREGTIHKEVPASLLILGGGPVGSELAQAWRSLGSEVTLVEGGERILSREEPFASDEVAAALRDAGVDVRTGVKVTKVARDGAVTATLDDGSTITADELLVAIGRVPNSADIGLESVGVEGAGRPVEVDEDLRVLPWLYAIGDVNGRAPFTHQGKEQARCVAAHLLGREDCRPLLDGGRSPRVTFTEPQVAAVGYTEQAARDAGLDVQIAEAELNATAGGSFTGKGVAGTCKLVVDAARGVVVGATFTGAQVDGMLQAATIAIVGEVPVSVLRHAVPAFPSRSEVWLKLWEALDG